MIRSHEKVYIDGAWVPSTGTETTAVISPHTEEVIATVPDGTAADMDRAVEAARRAFDTSGWPTAPVEERLELLERLLAVYQTRIPDFAELITAEMGAPISFSQMGQAGFPAAMIASFIELARRFPWEEERAGAFVPSVTVRHEPVGVVAAIMPWNVPQSVTVSKLIPALIGGNTVVLKCAPETPLDGFLLMELLDELGLPPGVVNFVPAGREVGEHLVSHPGVDKVAFTGSTAAGRRIAAICGEQLKRCSLELGGKSAAIILDDADLAATAEGLKGASLGNSGQQCTNQARILAPRDQYDDVVSAVVEMMESLAVGDPWDPGTEIGPMVSERQQARVDGYITLGQDEGAKLVLGGNGRPEGLDRGWYVQPSVFVGATNDMRICREEIFGPVVAVIPYDSVDEAVQIANDSEYGLSGSVWTSDPELGASVARRIRTGTIGVNQGAADPFAPFGGFKASGIGREMGLEGLGLYVEKKSLFPPPVPV